MQIKKIDITDKQYQQLILQKGSVFNTTEWLRMYKNNVQTLGVYDNNELIAVFNIYTFSKAFLKFCIPPPYSPDCALVVSTESKTAAIVSFINNWLNSSKNNRFAQFRFCLPYKYTEYKKQLSDSTFKKKLNHTYTLNISSIEDVQSLYAPKRRQQIRRAIKDGLSTMPISDMNIVFELVKKTYARQGKYFDELMTKKVLFEFANKKNSFAFATKINKEYAVVYFCVYHNKEAFYLMGGYDERLKHIGAGPLAMNACIEHAKKIGLHIYDFEGSMEPSIEKYFKEFGGTKQHYLCLEKTNNLGTAAEKIKKLLRKQ